MSPDIMQFVQTNIWLILIAVASGGMNGKAAPAASDIQHPLAPLEPELAAGQLQLGLLGRFQRRPIS